jgi:serine/threonine protein kinase
MNLKKHKLVGVGAFGRVWAVTIESYKSHSQNYFKPTDNQTVYALKEMSKPLIVSKGAVKIANNEVKIWRSIPQSEFIVNLWHAFQDEQSTYLLMDYAP